MMKSLWVHKIIFDITTEYLARLYEELREELVCYTSIPMEDSTEYTAYSWSIENVESRYRRILGDGATIELIEQISDPVKLKETRDKLWSQRQELEKKLFKNF